jgi:DNA topoisomerase-1
VASTATGRKLVIVESPAKAKTIAGYLGDDYVVESSIGHVRDLPESAAEIPAKIKGETWARLGVDVDNEFTPYYVVSRDKRPHMTKLRGLLKDASELYLATDDDREGEAIAWHLADELKPKVPVHRMVFKEITPQAIREAVTTPRDMDMDLVEAQEARRILDRLYGYEVSPVLWKKVMSGLSAGRVQSVATRLVVDRERERMAFRSATYWDLDGSFDAGERHADRIFPARLHTVDDARVARGSDFTSLGELRQPSAGRVVHLDRSRAESLVEALRDSAFEVRAVERRPYTRRPYAPFRTTTLQQEASRKLGFGAAQTMSVAQRLYENGFITYMRTDSVTLSESAVSAARDQVRELFGADYLPDAPRTYQSKVKNAQEAHEAIRPAGERFRTPAQTGLAGAEFRLYELIWMRTVASQMKDAEGFSVSVRLGGRAATGEDVVFTASGRVITFHGFLKAYVEGADDPESETDDAQSRLPNVSEGDVVTAAAMRATGHETKPPARYTEATLVRELEERDIGRPSTYASIIGTILARGLCVQEGLGPGAGVAGVLRRPAAGGALLPAGVLRVHRHDGGRPRRHRGRQPRPGQRAGAVLLRRRRLGGPAQAGHRPRRDRRPRAGHLPGRRRHRPAGGPLRPVRRGRRRRARQRAGRPASRRAHGREGQGAAGQPRRRGTPARHPPGVRAAGRGQERPVRPVRHRDAP